MDVLQAEIAKKRRRIEEAEVLDDERRYFRRGDLLIKEEQEYYERCHIKIEPYDSEEETPMPSTSIRVEDAAEHATLPRREVVKRLRDRGEPILLFGESELESFQRLREWEILEPEVDRGLRNDFKEAMDQVDQAFVHEIIERQQGSEGSNFDIEEPEECNYDDILNEASRLGKGNRDYDMYIVYQFLQFLLRTWATQLNQRPAEEKETRRGKYATATFTHTQIYLKPLFRKLRAKTLPEDISQCLVEIVGYLLNRNYIKANDSYLQMAIGNSPWPIGVTMVGIHARTGREKIFSRNVAHVLNDETQRKYIQGLKRLMTKCQEFFPTDPSKCVEYSAPAPAPAPQALVTPSASKICNNRERVRNCVQI